jgi:hypothetical protein
MKTNYVRLAGGLGNQLFQFSLGESLEGKTYYFHFNDADTLVVSSLLQNRDSGPILVFNRFGLFKIFSNLALRLVGKFKDRGLTVFLTEKFLQFIATFSFRNKVIFRISSQMGIEKTVDGLDVNRLYIGYFQDYRSCQEISLVEILNEKELEILLGYKQLAQKELPIALQVRLGDYVSEKRFGIPSKQYFESALNRLDPSNNRNVWIFTNDIVALPEHLPRIQIENMRIIDEPEASPLLNLLIMALCSDFVISNSTFGWWAAYLSKNPEANVSYPWPWFRNSKTSYNLAPERWIPINANF